MRNRFLISVASAVLLSTAAMTQQPGSGAQSPAPTDMSGNAQGHLVVSGGSAPVTVLNVTLADGSSDSAGSFVATNTSGSITFGTPYIRQPFCLVTGTQATAPTWSAQSSQLVLSTIVNGSAYSYLCVARPGG